MSRRCCHGSVTYRHGRGSCPSLSSAEQAEHKAELSVTYSRTAGRLRALQTLFVQMRSPLPHRVISAPGSGTLTRSQTRWMVTCSGHCHAEGTSGGSLAELGNTEPLHLHATQESKKCSAPV